MNVDDPEWWNLAEFGESPTDGVVGSLQAELDQLAEAHWNKRKEGEKKTIIARPTLGTTFRILQYCI